MKKQILALLLSFISTLAFAQDNISILGKVIKNDKLIDGHTYFISYSEGGNTYAYPIDTKDYKSENIKNYVGKFVKINGVVKTSSLTLDGVVKKTTVLGIKSIKKMEASSLSIGSYVPTAKEMRQAPKGSRQPIQRDGGIELSDKAANIAIFAGAAMLLGSMLSK